MHFISSMFNSGIEVHVRTRHTEQKNCQCAYVKIPLQATSVRIDSDYGQLKLSLKVSDFTASYATPAGGPGEGEHEV
jgi:hypothetical protein